MRNNTTDLTLARNYLDKYRFLIKEYELVKAKQHDLYVRANDFYKAHDTDRRSFLKYYNRFKQSGKDPARTISSPLIAAVAYLLFP